MATQPHSQRGPGAALSKSILVVDDDHEVREAISLALMDEGYSIQEASNGADAIAHLENSADPPLVILLDLLMPVMNGEEFRCNQQHHGLWPAVPVVVMSAHPNIAETAAQIDAAAYLPKPLDLDALL